MTGVQTCALPIFAFDNPKYAAYTDKRAAKIAELAEAAVLRQRHVTAVLTTVQYVPEDD